MNKKIFSILLAMILMVSMLSMPVFADPTEGGSVQETGTETPEENLNNGSDEDGTEGTAINPTDGEQGGEQPAHETVKKSYKISLSIDESYLCPATDRVYTGDNAVTVDINRGVEKRVPLKVEVTEVAEEQVSDTDASETGEVSEEEATTATEGEPVVNGEENSPEPEEAAAVSEVPKPY